MSRRMKIAIGIIAYATAEFIGVWELGLPGLALVIIAAFGGAMIYKAEADEAQELADDILELNFKLIEEMGKETFTMDEVREILKQEDEKDE